MHERGTTKLIAAALLAGALLAGCGADSSDSGGNASQAEPAVGRADAPAAEEGTAGQGKAEADSAGANTTAEAPDLRVDQRSIIYTGSITVRVDNVTTAAAQATGIASAAGGFVGSDERQSGSGADTANLTLRIPAAEFSSVVDQLSKLGVEETRGINTEDVTEEVVDLDARISVQKARVESGKKLLAQANSLDDLVMLEREVATREADLASLEAKKRRLSDLTSLSTITVVLLDPDATSAAPDDEPPGFLAGLSGGWDALKASLAVLATVLGALLPWLIALGIPAAVAVYLIRRYRRRQLPPPAESN
ncbi:lipoprotein [Actinoplanes sp. OR16]|uniref:DUF4349 domain-containing protein n=1 Tax=Actinoplanes sp. OR16 TaxID=946334 RepID=UPI000F6B3389|nr:DUF4349 domain-containing protein [Actinoplanes sp. OR16]BBH64772.1 lipoprotein [Actinoplanes sp. OR16]